MKRHNYKLNKKPRTRREKKREREWKGTRKMAGPVYIVAREDD